MEGVGEWRLRPHPSPPRRTPGTHSAPDADTPARHRRFCLLARQTGREGRRITLMVKLDSIEQTNPSPSGDGGDVTTKDHIL